MKKFLVGLLFFVHIIAHADTFTISVPGYDAKVDEYKAKVDKRDVIVITLHGKEKGRKHEGNIAFARKLAKKGYTTYAPQMPWYDYSAPLSTAYIFLDALVKKVAVNGEKVVVAGHSQGAPYALFYTTDHKPPELVAGCVLLAPGHLIHRSPKIQRATADSVASAKQLVNEGKGNEKHKFSDFNKGGNIGYKTIITSPSIYLSYFGLDTSPNFLRVITQARLPLLWVDGKDDKLAKRMDYEEIYSTAHEHPQNEYSIVRGGHVSMWKPAATPVIEWLQQFE